MVNMHLGFGRQRVAAVVDVSPGGASVTIMSVQKSGPASLLAVGHSSIAVEKRTEAQARDAVTGHIQEAAQNAFGQLASSEQIRIDDVYVFLHAPFSRTQMVTAEHLFEDQVRIQDSHIAHLVQESVRGAGNIDLKNLLEGTVISVSLNGYPSTAAEGKYARRIRVTSIASDLDKQFKSSIENAVHRAFPISTIIWRTAVHAYMRIAQRAIQAHSYLIIDMGMDTTHICAVRDTFMDQLVVAEGMRSILERFAPNKTPEDALSQLRMLARDACSGDACDSMKQSIAAAEPELVRIFGESMSKVAALNKLPNTVLLVTHAELEPWLTSFLERIDFAQFTLTFLPLAVYGGTRLQIKKLVDDQEYAEPHALAAALVNIEAGE